jgi:hypothetical protein
MEFLADRAIDVRVFRPHATHVFGPLDVPIECSKGSAREYILDGHIRHFRAINMPLISDQFLSSH